jgi:predicted DNA-binding protein (MmcQ/YjbR family)
MLTRRDLIRQCLTYADAYEDYPFDEDRNDPAAWTVMRHKSNHKSFAMIFERGGRLNLNVKCDPAEADFLRNVYRSVTAAYHMNKEHWNGIAVDGSIPENEIFGWIDESFRLTAPKLKRRRTK